MARHHLDAHGVEPEVELELVDPMTIGYDYDDKLPPEDRALLLVSWPGMDFALCGPPDVVAKHLHGVGLRASRAANDLASGHAGIGVVKSW